MRSSAPTRPSTAALRADEIRRQLEAQARDCAEVQPLIDFLDTAKRGIVR
jgi:hypothetical protein